MGVLFPQENLHNIVDIRVIYDRPIDKIKVSRTAAAGGSLSFSLIIVLS